MIFKIKIVECLYKILYMLNKKNENYASLYKDIGLSHDTLQTALKYLLEKDLIVREDKGHKKSYYVISDRGKKYLELLVELKEFRI
ncbi:hypothetical protein HOE04_02040 [archaeon]|jgi:predicted transcriptional regulator|nr:hypothetical protein [archaeon]